MRGWLLCLGWVACAKRAPVLEPPPPPVAELACPEGTVELKVITAGLTDTSCRRQEAPSVRHGPAVTRRPDGSLVERGAWADGQRTGHWWTWDAEERLVRDGDFEGGHEAGWWMEYGPDGAVVAEGSMVDGKRHGVWVVREEAGTWEEPWREGELHGVALLRGPDGRPLRERVYADGRLVTQRELR